MSETAQRSALTLIRKILLLERKSGYGTIVALTASLGTRRSRCAFLQITGSPKAFVYILCRVDSYRRGLLKL